MDEFVEKEVDSSLPLEPETPKADSKLASFFKAHKKPSIIVGSILLLIFVGYVAYAINGQMRKTTSGNLPLPSLASSTSGTASSAPVATAAAYLDGVMVPEGKENLHPLAVMIENHPDARPQSGLGQANLVYEAIAEGGITRFMAVFRDPSVPVRVGPIRSARTYFVDFADEIGAFYAHVGGNMDALDQIKQGSTLDLDQFSLGEPVYKRDYTKNVALEHTMYSSTDKLWDYATTNKKWPTQGNFERWLFKDDIAQNLRPAAQTVNVSVSDSLYAVRWDYDSATNSYKRSEAGTVHIDADTGKQITAKNIVLQTVDRVATVTKINEHGWIYTLTGSGSALVALDGKVIKGRWVKQGSSRTRYYDEANQEIVFNRGTIWVQLIHSDSTVSY